MAPKQKTLIAVCQEGRCEKLPRSGPGMAGLAERLKAAPGRLTAQDFILRIPALRAEFGIPPAKPGQRYGGWDTATQANKADFYLVANGFREPPGGGADVPLAYKMIAPYPFTHRTKRREYLGFAAYGEHVAKQIAALDATAWGVDPGLTLAIAQRESTRPAFMLPGFRAHSYAQGGLDSLYQEQFHLRKYGYLPPDFSKKLDPAPRQGNDYKVPHWVFPAYIQSDRLITAYGAYLNRCRKQLLDAAIELWPADRFDLAKTSMDALRVWTAMFFVQRAYPQSTLKKLKVQGWSLNKIVNNPLFMNNDIYRYSVVRAAEAKLLDELLELPAATRWSVDYMWALPTSGA